MIPMYFGRSERPLFGVYHPAESWNGRPGVVISGPVGHEYVRVHRMCRVLAQFLGRHGAPTLRFDYTGTGDSWGESEDGNLTVWKDDLVSAVEELRDTSGCREVDILGIRLGASIAVLVEEFPCPVNLLMLWDPVVDGQLYMEELVRKHTAWLDIPPEPGLPTELLGSTLSPDLLRDVRELDLNDLEMKNGTKVILATSETRPDYAALEERVKTLGVDVERLLVEDEYDWHDPQKVETIVTAPNMLRALLTRMGAE
jgi:pimeloyl-ACP methyl ester carboxylesterase